MKHIIRLFVLAAVMCLAWLNWTHASEDMVQPALRPSKGTCSRLKESTTF